jgi:hypothetical protein
VTIEERLTTLERLNRRLTLALVSVGTAAILAVAMGQGAPAVVPQEITAHMFTVLDNNGKIRAELGVDKAGAGLSLGDENGKPRAVLGVLKDGPILRLLDENDKPRAVLYVGRGGPGVSLLDENGKLRAVLYVGKDGSVLSLTDANGRVLRQLP